MHTSILASRCRLRSLAQASLLTAWFAGQAMAQLSSAPVVINEFAYDDTGADNREFIELWNRSGASVNISSWKLFAETGPASSTLLATVPAATTLLANQRWLLAQPFWVARNQDLAANLPDTATVLVLRDVPLTRIDSVAYEGHAGLWLGAPVEGQPVFPEFVSTDGFDTSWSRVRDGHDTDRNSRDFRIARATPGTSNNQTPIAGYSENADALAVGASVPGWYGSQAAPIVVSAAATVLTPGVFLPAAPLPGAPNDRCLAFQPGVNNGTCYWVEDDVAASVRFDGLVYLDARPLGGIDRHSWSIGVRGGTGSPHAVPQLPVSTPADINGDRGVTWTYVSTAAGHTLYLVDHGDGGRDHTVLATIPITTSGWQRLRIGASGTLCEARYGGTVGTTSGTLYRRNVHMGEGDLFVGVRNEGTVAMAMFADQIDTDEPDDPQSNNGGSGCQGNCTIVNKDAKTLDKVLAEKTPAGTYAVQVVPPPLLGITFSQVCFYTSQKGDTAPVTSVRILNDASGTPGTPVVGAVGSLVLHADDAKAATWWAAPINLHRTQAFWVELTFDGELNAPLAATQADTDGNALEVQQQAYWSHDGTSWTAAGLLPWTLTFVCDKSGYVDSVLMSDATIGGIVEVEVSGGGGLLPVLGFLGFAPTSIDLAFLGAPGCTLLVDPTGWMTFLALTTACGTATWSIPVPFSPVFLGAQGHFQFAGVDPTLNALGLATSDRLTVTIQ